MPVQHRHVPARLRQHLPRLVGQRARGLRSTRPSVRAASSQRHIVRTFTPPTWAPARTCAVVNAPAAASSSSSRATSTGLDTLNPAVTSPHTPDSPTE
ncbi:hypothetical protein ACWD6R_36020 [Streptomyces sp. NPDC005151]